MPTTWLSTRFGVASRIHREFTSDLPVERPDTPQEQAGVPRPIPARQCPEALLKTGIPVLNVRNSPVDKFILTRVLPNGKIGFGVFAVNGRINNTLAKPKPYRKPKTNEKNLLTDPHGSDGLRASHPRSGQGRNQRGRHRCGKFDRRYQRTG